MEETVTDNLDGTWSWSFDTSDGPDESQTVDITGTDDDGEFDVASFTLTVDNVAPAVTVDSDPVTVNEGETATNSGTYSDPGDDTVRDQIFAGLATRPHARAIVDGLETVRRQPADISFRNEVEFARIIDLILEDELDMDIQ